MKLKCTAHGQRVFVLESGAVHHRAKGSQSLCDSQTVKIGTRVLTAAEVVPKNAWGVVIVELR